MTRWQDYFEESYRGYHSVLEGEVAHWSFYNPVYGRIRAALPKGSRILDVGSGPGTSDIYLQACGYEVIGIDNDPKIVEMSLENARRHRSTAQFVLGDAFDLSPHYGAYDLVYSVGVVEHFDRDVTVKLLAEQAKCGEWVLCVVPARLIKYVVAPTDERFYSMGELRSIVTEAGLSVIETFGFGDIPAPVHLFIKRILPYGLWRFLQNRFAYATSMGVLAKRSRS